jgi:hypothetical protein
MQDDIFEEEKPGRAEISSRNEQDGGDAWEEIFEEEPADEPKKRRPIKRRRFGIRTSLSAIGLLFFLFLIIVGILFTLSYQVTPPLKSKAGPISFRIPSEKAEKPNNKAAPESKKPSETEKQPINDKAIIIAKKEPENKPESKPEDQQKSKQKYKTEKKAGETAQPKPEHKPDEGIRVERRADDKASTKTTPNHKTDEKSTTGDLIVVPAAEKDIRTAFDKAGVNETASPKKEIDRQPDTTHNYASNDTPNHKTDRKTERKPKLPTGGNIKTEGDRKTVKTAAETGHQPDSAEESRQLTETGEKDSPPVARVSESESIKRKEKRTVTIPYLVHLIKKSEYQEAALTYRKNLKPYAKDYSIRLEVVCNPRSIQTAFEEAAFNLKMFILPKKLKGKSCFGVFWGIYPSPEEARNDLKTIPSFFSEQDYPPVPVYLGPYL